MKTNTYNTMKITLINSFHNTRTTLNAKTIKHKSLYVTPAQIKRTKKTLCGVSKCTCGGELGERPGLPWFNAVDAPGLLIDINDVEAKCKINNRGKHK